MNNNNYIRLLTIYLTRQYKFHFIYLNIVDEAIVIVFYFT